ncbi:unnamed protein product [Amaranthus hypochondriacus]
MNVVGKVGSLITQGVYSVATPFHPFGGAVDIIVVQQQDGSFRSTPWYVQFGKFQGVLKGAEKMVQINVNGVEANFHMHLDNSGEAYFVREADSIEIGDQNKVLKDEKEPTLDHSFSVDNSQCNIDDNNVENFRLQSTLSDPGVFSEDYSSFDRLERTDSDACRFYDFQDDQSFDESIELSSEYGSSRYENMEGVENFVEAQGSDSEMVLVSVDGHILTAPISSSEHKTEIVQLDTPQFHLGPGKDSTWDSQYLNDLELPSIKSESVAASSHEGIARIVEIEARTHEDRESDGNGIRRSEVCLNEETDNKLELGSCKENGESTHIKVNTCVDFEVYTKSEFEAIGEGTILHEDGVEEMHFPEALDNGESEHEEHDTSIKHQERDVYGHIDIEEVIDSKERDRTGEEANDYGFMPASNALACKDEPSKRIISETVSDESEDRRQHASSSSDQTQSNLKPTLEISLCSHLLRPGMGLAAADEVFNAHRISEEEFTTTSSSLIKNENLIIRYNEKYLQWEQAAPFVLGLAAFGVNLPIESKDAIPVEQEVTSNLGLHDSGSASGRRWRLWPIPFRRVKTLPRSTSNTSESEEVFVDSESFSRSPSVNITGTSPCDTPFSVTGSKSAHKKIVRTNIPTNDQISSLNLKEGQNDVTFSFSTRVLGLQQVEAHIYLWKWNARIVISDVDGTITRSDVLGQFMPLVGKDWSQSGVARLFSAIKENGYQLLFLSARAIVQAYLTKSFLFNLKQDGKTLPNGPVVISPNGLFPSLYREVIRRAPHEFKIACLEDIKALFPPDYNPFYAGFGNRDTDELTYRKIGIPKGKIFIINPKGEVAINHRIDVKSYTSLHTLVNDMFPPTSMVEQEDYNAWNFWKVPLPDIDA